ncbi:MAG: ATP-binding cassette domain-containing protein [Prolixibacteraceae bacterium]|jgi:lipopolysaccharide transport system ATP-binding protein|nr:ATP-binding cassette domain-containing protein [Prolixibacteraceae bacterium]
MSDKAIKIENLSKQYRLGLVGTGTLMHDLNRWWATSLRGKEDPYLKIGETNIQGTRGASDYVWALKDINLEVKQGEVLGIIGKNGSGKSTLLKILSRVTKPTTGSVNYKGRIASLLEVGTGFHPEMTGRENIFMNGSIMGMTRTEIKSKLDEIVDFAGVERYIDTPVKRYSSGMTVRLGFAIAAHLEPEILIVDEVLAVGDAEFQKKAVGKIKDVSQSNGRTVLFVSHNMGAIQNLCEKCILLENGEIIQIGSTSNVVLKYLNNFTKNKTFQRPVQSNNNPTITTGKVENKDNSIAINLSIYSAEHKEISIDLRLKDSKGNNVGFGSLGAFSSDQLIKIQPGKNIIQFQFSSKIIAVGNYYISLDLTLPGLCYYDRLEDCLYIEIIRNPEHPVTGVLNQGWGYGSLEIPIILQ